MTGPGPPSWAPPPPTPTSNRRERMKSAIQNGIPSTSTAANAGIASRTRRRAASTNSPCEASDEQPVRMRGDRREDRDAPRAPSAGGPPRSSASSRPRYESALVSRKSAYIRPKTAWKSTTQLVATIAVATSAIVRPARREQSAATTGSARIAHADESARSAMCPPPRWTTTHASMKWSGAPPRSPSTVASAWPSECRPTKSASVSSSCGGQASIFSAQKTQSQSIASPTPIRNGSSPISPTAHRRRPANRLPGSPETGLRRGNGRPQRQASARAGSRQPRC